MVQNVDFENRKEQGIRLNVDKNPKNTLQKKLK
jgi:hypothetical protein